MKQSEPERDRLGRMKLPPGFVYDEYGLKGGELPSNGAIGTTAPKVKLQLVSQDKQGVVFTESKPKGKGYTIDKDSTLGKALKDNFEAQKQMYDLFIQVKDDTLKEKKEEIIEILMDYQVEHKPTSDDEMGEIIGLIRRKLDIKN